ncbi:MAG: hypothetical protein Q9174_002031 [Haloplaca sp. 1 TL-2023]
MVPQPKKHMSATHLQISPHSPNSWTARSFDTLRPSESPSMAGFPKHAEAPLLFVPEVGEHQVAAPSMSQPTKEKQISRSSFFARHCRLIFCIVIFHTSLLTLTTMLVMILTAVMSKPQKHIQPGYYIGLMLSASVAFASCIGIYVKWQERLRKRASQWDEFSTHEAVHARDPRFGTPAFTGPGQEVDELMAVVSNWGPTAAVGAAAQLRPGLRSMIAAHKQPSAMANLGHQHNHQVSTQMQIPLAVNEQGIEMATFPSARQEKHIDEDLVAAFEERQRITKRRVKHWLKDVDITAPQAPPPTPLQYHSERLPRTTSKSPPEASSTVRAQESLFSLASPRPGSASPLPRLRIQPSEESISAAPSAPSAPSMQLSTSLSKSAGPKLPSPVRILPSESGDSHTPPTRFEEPDIYPAVLSAHDLQVEKYGTPTHPAELPSPEIDYASLPPPIPRPGAKARDPVLSDPVTVVHVGTEPAAPAVPDLPAHPGVRPLQQSQRHLSPPVTSSPITAVAPKGIGKGKEPSGLLQKETGLEEETGLQKETGVAKAKGLGIEMAMAKDTGMEKETGLEKEVPFNRTHYLQQRERAEWAKAGVKSQRSVEFRPPAVVVEKKKGAWWRRLWGKN